MKQKTFSSDRLLLDPEQEVEQIGDFMRKVLIKDLRRRGIVLGVSGGIDSAVTAALAVRCLGKERVHCILMPERESSPDTLTLSRLLVDHLGVDHSLEDITETLHAVGFYRRYQEAVRRVVPEYGTGWGSKLVTTDPIEGGGFTFFSLVVADPAGVQKTVRLPIEVYLDIVATTNFKQRCRKQMEYYYADRLNFAVAGTPNLLEYDQGFFVKNGDGAADLKPIAHLYKSQVYQLADYLGVPEQIRLRPPTTDTFSLAQGQDEFFFALPYQKMDLCLYGLNHQIDPAEVGVAVGLQADQVRKVWANLEQKRSTVRYLHLSPLVLRRLPETQREEARGTLHAP